MNNTTQELTLEQSTIKELFTTTTTLRTPITSDRPPLYGTGFITMVSLIVCMVPLGCLVICCTRAFIRSRWKKRRIAVEKSENLQKNAKKKAKEEIKKKKVVQKQTFVSDQV